MPVRPLTVALASVTVRVVFLTSSDAPSFEHGERVDPTHRLGRRADDLGQHRQHGLDDRGLVELAVGVRAQGEGLRLRLALGQDDARLGVALEGGLLGRRLGVDLGDAGVGLALHDLDRGVGLAGEPDPLRVRLGRRDPRQLLALGALDLGVGVGLGGPDRRRDELLLLPVGLELGELGLLADDLRVASAWASGPDWAALASAACVSASTSAWRSDTSRWAFSLICWDSALGPPPPGRRWPWPCGRRARGEPSPAGR